METIGSVSAMYRLANSSSSTADSDFVNFQRESDPRAEQILQCNGIEAFEEYLRDSEAIRARRLKEEQKEALAKLAFKAELRAATHRILNVEAKFEKKLMNIVSKVVTKTAGRHGRLLQG